MLEYYAFALFIAGLICVIAIICKVLFANVKRQKKLLDERESQILQLYTSVETLMEEFNDQIKITTEELKEKEYRATAHMTAFDLPPELEKKEQVLERLPRTLPFDANRIRAAGEVLERAERITRNDNTLNSNNLNNTNYTSNTTGVNNIALQQHPEPVIKPETPEKTNNTAIFQKFFDESIEAHPSPAELSNTQTRSNAILALSERGKSDVEIASELGITRNEVQLVIGLKK